MKGQISKKLSRVYIQRGEAEKLAEAYADKMRGRGYKVSCYRVADSGQFMVDVFCKK